MEVVETTESGSTGADAISWPLTLRNGNNDADVGMGVGIKFKGSGYSSGSSNLSNSENDKWAGIIGIADDHGSGDPKWWDNIGLAFILVKM